VPQAADVPQSLPVGTAAQIMAAATSSGASAPAAGTIRRAAPAAAAAPLSAGAVAVDRLPLRPPSARLLTCRSVQPEGSASSRVRDWDAFNQEYEQRERERLRSLGEADFHTPKRPRRYGRARSGALDEALQN